MNTNHWYHAENDKIQFRCFNTFLNHAPLFQQPGPDWTFYTRLAFIYLFFFCVKTKTTKKTKTHTQPCTQHTYTHTKKNKRKKI